MFEKKFFLLALLATMTALLCPVEYLYAGNGGHEGLSVQEERERLVDLFRSEGVDAVPELKEFLGHDRSFLARTAAHLLVRLGEPALDGIEKALEHPDFRVRRIAVDGIVDMGIVEGYWQIVLMDENTSLQRDVRFVHLPNYVDQAGADAIKEELMNAYRNGSEGIRKNVVKMVSEIAPLTQKAKSLLVEAAGDDVDEIRRHAFRVVVEPTIDGMRELAGSEDWQAMIDVFADEDIAAWPDTRARDIGGVQATSEASEAHYRLGRAYYGLEKGGEAETQLKASIDRDPGAGGGAGTRYRAAVWRLMGDNYRYNLGLDDKAIDAYIHAFEMGGTSARGLGPFLTAVSMLREKERYGCAQELLSKLNTDGLSGVWRYRVFSTYGAVLAADGKTEEALAKYNEFLEAENISSSWRDSIKDAIDELEKK